VVVLLVTGGLCLSLFAVFVQRLRHEAAKTNCRNNSRVIALGTCANYYDTNGRFPPGTIRNAELPVERRFSWLIDLLSYIESTMIKHPRTGPWDAEENPMKFARCLTFLCPANPERSREDGVGLTHYVGIAGLGVEAARLPSGHRAAGVFGYDRATHKEDITDGLATTVLVIETTTNLGPWLAGGPSTVRGLDPDSIVYVDRGGQFGSYHPVGNTWRSGGAQACFADGSVRVLNRDIDRTVLEALVTIAGGEDVSPPWSEEDSLPNQPSLLLQWLICAAPGECGLAPSPVVVRPSVGPGALVGCRFAHVNPRHRSPDGQTLTSGSGDGIVRFWPWPQVLARPSSRSKR
jgi:hypothetical protein